MSKRVEVVALHKPDDSGQVTELIVRIDSIYPEVAAAEATKQAVGGLLDAITRLCATDPVPDTQE